ncbi:hypothetical protein ScPMuIL_001282 [Solemya velum]
MKAECKTAECRQFIKHISEKSDMCQLHQTHPSVLKMSNPLRQMNNRRLPPLPPNSHNRTPSPKKHRLVHSMVVTGKQNPNADVDGADVDGACFLCEFKLQNFTTPSDSSTTYLSTSAELTAITITIHANLKTDMKTEENSLNLQQETVFQYLDEFPECLDSYIHHHVCLERLQTWVRNKLQISKPDNKSCNTSQRHNGFHNHVSFEIQHCEPSKKGHLLQKVRKEISSQSNKADVLRKLSNCVAVATNADGWNFYLVNKETQVIYLYFQTDSFHLYFSERSFCIGKIGSKTTVPAHVALTCQPLRTEEINGDERFPLGLGVKNDRAKSALVFPVLQESSNIIGVIELYRYSENPGFTFEDEETGQCLTVWGCFAVFYAELYNSMNRQKGLTEFLLAVTKSIFQDIVSMDTVIVKIMNYAKKLVDADRASLFLLDTTTKELYARIFDTGFVGEIVEVPQKEIRFPMDKGVAGHVATTGTILNIPDAYCDDRFNREVDLQTGYTTKSLLCMPIYIRGSIIGVVQMVNKLNGVFTKSDEQSFETFAIYCGLALHHAKLYEKIHRSEQKYRVALEVLSYHSKSSDDETASLVNKHMPEVIEGISRYEFSPWAVTYEDKPLYVLYMFKEFLRDARFDMNVLARFTLTVRKNYRPVPYHNWDHAFSVANTMYTIIKTNHHHQFTPMECLSMFVACLCHDLDHRGKTNAYMVKSASPLAAIYSTSTMEHHHFNQTVTILQNEGHNIFKYLSLDEYKQILGNIKQCILATDLAQFFGNKAALQKVADAGEFSWEKTDHRYLIMTILMTSSDLCAMSKPWDVQYPIVTTITDEFWRQGDEEKSRGLVPMPMMDRDKESELPQLEVGFLAGICLPCYELMARYLPESQPMVDGAKENLRRWKELASQNEEKEKTTGTK